MVEIHHFSPFRLFTAATWTVTIVNSCNRHTKDIAQPKWHTFLTFPTIHSCNMDSDHRELIGTQRILHNQNDTHCHKRPAQGCSNLKIAYRIISNISTVLYFFNVPPPRAINGDVPLLETVPLLFQSHFRGMLPCQIHVWHTHFRFFFAGTDNEFTQCAYNGDWALYFLNAAPMCSIIGDVLLLETVLISEIIRYLQVGQKFTISHLSEYSQLQHGQWPSWIPAIGTQSVEHNRNDTHCHKRLAQGCWTLKIAYLQVWGFLPVHPDLELRPVTAGSNVLGHCLWVQAAC